MKKTRFAHYIYAGLFTALLAVLSQLSIPMPSAVPLTLQTFGVALCGYFLGAKTSFLSYLTYYLLGAVGVPVFSNLTGGFGKLTGPTGGFLLGFFFLVCLCGLFANSSSSSLRPISKHLLPLSSGLLGLLLCHVLGVLQFSFLSGNSFLQSCFLVSFPYFIKDILSIVLAYLFSKLLRRRFSAYIN